MFIFQTEKEFKTKNYELKILFIMCGKKNLQSPRNSVFFCSVPWTNDVSTYIYLHLSQNTLCNNRIWFMHFYTFLTMPFIVELYEEMCISYCVDLGCDAAELFLTLHH